MANSDDPPAWALDFIDNLRSGDISSVTKAKDIASDLWRQHSTGYDNKPKLTKSKYAIYNILLSNKLKPL
jgi:hypothetical protein